MTEEQFIERCRTAYRKFGWPQLTQTLHHAAEMTDALLSLEGGQVKDFVEYMSAASRRTEGFSPSRTLASDRYGYNVIQFLALLNHPCQQCAVDTDAWHTRTGFCEHKGKDV